MWRASMKCGRNSKRSCSSCAARSVLIVWERVFREALYSLVVLAATNRVDILAKALLRPGRFDRHITVSLLDHVGREAILKVHTRHTPLREDVSLERLSRLTTGMSVADLANLVNEAALTAA